MAFMYEFPHTSNFDSDLREIIELYFTVKNLPKTWENYKQMMDSEFAELKNFVNNYFDNLDVQNEINNKLDSMLNDGLIGYVTPEMYGAVGDGVADDTVAVRAAFNSVKGIILLSNKYRITSKIDINKDNLTIIGGKLVLDDATAEEFILDIMGSDILIDSVIFEHVEYVNALNNNSQNGIRLSYCNRVTINNCDFIAKNTAINGILDFYNDWKNVTIDNSRFVIDTYFNDKYHAGGVWIRDFYKTATCENLIISNCVFNSKSLDEILAIWSTVGGIKNVNISNCQFTGEQMPHMVTVCADNVDINGCAFYSKAINTILKCFFDDAVAKNIFVHGCQFYDTLEREDPSFYSIRQSTNGKTNVADCVFDGYSFGSILCEFSNCFIKTTSNKSINYGSKFYGCKIENVQTANSFVNSSTTFLNCIIKTLGQFIQSITDGATYYICGNFIQCEDSLFLIGSVDSLKVIMNNNFYGTSAPNFYATIKDSDIVMCNRFAISPNQNNSNLPKGWDTNVIG